MAIHYSVLAEYLNPIIGIFKEKFCDGFLLDTWQENDEISFIEMSKILEIINNGMEWGLKEYQILLIANRLIMQSMTSGACEYCYFLQDSDKEEITDIVDFMRMHNHDKSIRFAKNIIKALYSNILFSPDFQISEEEYLIRLFGDAVHEIKMLDSTIDIIHSKFREEGRLNISEFDKLTKVAKFILDQEWLEVESSS